MIAFSICSANFLSYALTLEQSLRHKHPGLKFYLALCDKPIPALEHSLPFETLSIYDLGIPNLEEMVDRYNITELNTAIKPFVFLKLFDQHPGQCVTYFDPDIQIFDELVELREAHDRGADCVLTPHILEPAEFAEMNDVQFLKYGIFNLGFCSIRDTSETRRIVSWWSRRLERDCLIDLANGIFVDQKWADLFPAMIDNFHSLRHPGYNVAYWNLSQRRLMLDGKRWSVNGKPLRFFPF